MAGPAVSIFNPNSGLSQAARRTISKVAIQVAAVPPMMTAASMPAESPLPCKRMRDHDDRGLVHDVIGKDRVGEIAPHGGVLRHPAPRKAEHDDHAEPLIEAVGDRRCKDLIGMPPSRTDRR